MIAQRGCEGQIPSAGDPRPVIRFQKKDAMDRDDLSTWMKRFPLDEFLPRFFSLDSVQTPLDLASIEQIRARVAACGSVGKSRPTDSLIFIKGDARARHMTKIGGAPYRPSGASWPQREDGAPMTFLAQFSFAESRDLFGDLPGEVLLIFARDDDLYLGDPPCLSFEWQPADLTSLIDPSDVPPPAWPFARCYAISYRTVDFEDEAKVAEQAKPVCRDARMHRGRIPDMLRSIARLPSAKIGGLPHWKYPDQHEGIERHGPVLCALGDVSPGTDIAPPPPEVDWWADDGNDDSDDDPEDYLMWRDGCQMNFFLGAGGAVTWSVDFG